jgi:hypothetical protein
MAAVKDNGKPDTASEGRDESFMQSVARYLSIAFKVDGANGVVVSA